MQTYVCPQAPNSSWELAPEFAQRQAALCIRQVHRDRHGVRGTRAWAWFDPHSFVQRLHLSVPSKYHYWSVGPRLGNMGTEGYDRTLTLAPSSFTYPKIIWFFVENCNPKPKPQGPSGCY